MSFLKKTSLILLFFAFFFVPAVFSAGDCRNISGAQCLTAGECADKGSGWEIDQLTSCLGSGGEVCCIPANNATPSPEAESCASSGGACFPSSTACYGGSENELSSACGENQHCCKQTVNSCSANGGTCLDHGWVCKETVLQYSCEENRTCCGKKIENDSGAGAWQSGLQKANQAAKLPDANFKDVLSRTLSYILSLLTILGVLFFVLTGLKYIFAGSTGTAEKSKLGIQHLITGITIGLSGYIIIKLIDALLQGSFLWYF